jgi:osmotically-inducible protein OsmY
MKTLIATLLAAAAGASYAAPTAALNHDPATYRLITQQVNADYQVAVTKCDSKPGNDKNVCLAEAKLARTHAEAKALSQYNSSPAGQARVRTVVADAEYGVAKAKCDGKSGADKDSCMNEAKSVHTAALADAKADHPSASAIGSSAAGNLVSGTDNPAKAAAVDKCAQLGADANTGCVVETKPSAVRDTAAAATERTEAAASGAAVKTRDAAAVATDKTKTVAAAAVEKTKEVAHVVIDKTRALAATVAQKTENTVDRAATSPVAQKTDNALDRAGDKTQDAASKTRVVAADTAITTKVKAGLVKEPNLESLGIHVETEKGVVMLSGFVNSKAEADKAVQVAKGVDGVATVKSAIQVK